MLWERLEAHWRLAPKWKKPAKPKPDIGKLAIYRSRMLKKPTRGERRFKAAYKATGIKYKLICQQVFISRNKAYITDFFIPRLSLIVEIDGPSHDTEEAREYDRKRTKYLRSLGLEVIRYTNLETNQPAFPEKIRKRIKSLAWRKPAAAKVAKLCPEFKTPSERLPSGSCASKNKAKPITKYLVRKKPKT